MSRRFPGARPTPRTVNGSRSCYNTGWWGSFVPPTEIQDLRDLTRYRVELTRAQNRVANRIQKLLEQANIKLSSVASNTLGVSGQQMLEAIIAGEEDPERLADLAQRRLREKIPELRLALHGRVRDHHRFLAKARRGVKRAVMAVAHTMLIIAFTMLKTGRSYHELGGNYLE